MLIRRISEQLQIDKPLLYAMAARAWQAGAGMVTIGFLIEAMTLGEQGIYYSLSAILGIQMFFELGLLNILVSQAGHMTSDLQTESGRTGMSELIRGSSRWFGIAAGLFATTALISGWFVLQAKNTEMAWQYPLIMLVLASAVSVSLSPKMSILEGAGHREDIYRYRLFQMVTGHLSVWIMLSMGWKLWALVASAGVQTFWFLYVSKVRFAGFFQQFQTTNLDNSLTAVGFSWMKDVMPLQWRLALVSVTYHFATQFFTVIVVAFHSEEEAGRLGMTLAVTTAIQSMALAWVHTKFSLASAQHGAGNREAAGTMWRRTAVVSTSLLFTALTVCILGIAALPMLEMNIENRFIAPWQVAVLGIGCIANHIIALEGWYVLSRRGRPFLVPSMIGFGSTALAVWAGGYVSSVTGVVIGYATTTALITLPLHTWAYLEFRKHGSRRTA